MSANLPVSGDRTRKADLGRGHFAAFECVDAVFPEVPLQLKVGAGPDGEVSAERRVDVAQQDPEQQREVVDDAVVRESVVRRVVAIDVRSVERSRRAFGPWESERDLAFPGPLDPTVPKERAHARPDGTVRRKAKEPRIGDELFAEGSGVHAHDVAALESGPEGVVDRAPCTADETFRYHARQVQESPLHERPSRSVRDRIG